MALQSVNHKEARHEKQPSILNSVVREFNLNVIDVSVLEFVHAYETWSVTSREE